MSGRCIICGRVSKLITSTLGICASCLKQGGEKVFDHIQRVHAETRREFDLPLKPPRSPEGAKCYLCVNECSIPPGERGYCGLRENREGKLSHIAGTAQKGLADWYYDPLPTNCVADWVCPAGTSAGYPKFSYSSGAEYGYKNLAVFYGACSFNCLFCQNWHYRDLLSDPHFRSAEELAEAVDNRTACICYFGGDPTPQMPHALRASELALERAKGRILRICWETNGSMNRAYLEKAAELSLKSGGCIKFDLKAWNENINIALCGITNQRTLENFRYLAQWTKERPDPPFLIASTLLIPGYIDVEEVSNIAHFIADLDPDIPYSLLAFHPNFYLHDLPQTSKLHAQECKQAALDAGLTRVKIGNLHLLI